MALVGVKVLEVGALRAAGVVEVIHRVRARTGTMGSSSICVGQSRPERPPPQSTHQDLGGNRAGPRGTLARNLRRPPIPYPLPDFCRFS